MHRVRLGALAERQLAHALAWYDVEAPEQVARLLSSFEEARKRVGSKPLLFRETEPGLRRVALRTFPYHLWYAMDGDVVVIVAMTHFRQDTSRLASETEP